MLTFRARRYFQIGSDSKLDYDEFLVCKLLSENYEKACS